MNGTVNEFDVVVVGGGMVGAAAAGLLGRCGFSVAVIEHRAPQRFDPEKPVGLRVSAIAPGSAMVLAQAGAWDVIERTRACAYRAMHVEEAGQAGGLDFEAEAFGLERLGTIVENDLVQWALWGALDNNPMVDCFAPARLASFAPTAGRVELTLDDGQRLSAGLLLAADGAASPLRRHLGIRQDIWEYNQKGIVCVAESEPANPGIAWQRFLPGGPLAFLPLSSGRSSLVWTRPAAEADALLALSDEDFIDALNAAAEGGIGRVRSIGPRAAFPLAMRLSESYRSGRVVLLGDAAHAVHPLAGQGVNLGLADVAALVETLVGQRLVGANRELERRLAHWQRWRRSESEMMAGGTHAIRALFTAPGLSAARAFGLGLVGRSWLARDFFIRRAAGITRNAPALARGVPLKDLLRAS